MVRGPREFPLRFFKMVQVIRHRSLLPSNGFATLAPLGQERVLHCNLYSLAARPSSWCKWAPAAGVFHNASVALEEHAVSKHAPEAQNKEETNAKEEFLLGHGLSPWLGSQAKGPAQCLGAASCPGA